MNTLRRWLARLAFSFLIIALVLMWEGYKALGAGNRPVQPTRAVACFIGAGAALTLAGKGIQERHRPM